MATIYNWKYHCSCGAVLQEVDNFLVCPIHGKRVKRDG